MPKNLEEIFDYHVEYSFDYAVKFQEDLSSYIHINLEQFPKIGHLYNESKMIYRLIYDKHNIYYKIENNQVSIYLVIGSKLELNELLKKDDIELW